MHNGFFVQGDVTSYSCRVQKYKQVLPLIKTYCWFSRSFIGFKNLLTLYHAQVIQQITFVKKSLYLDTCILTAIPINNKQTKENQMSVRTFEIKSALD